MRILVSGANGFVGRALCGHLHTHGHVAIPAVRRGSGLAGEVVVGDISGANDWTVALAGCDAVVHLAARVHVMNDTE
ncbi:MAG: NAD-dependent epimerase/dehydratase family protein, partial [Thiobacillus sp.]|nr:NAD-dependent epimerase/dehydratase family protein [Thiobacillus sp.]